MNLIENAFELAEAGDDDGMDSYDREKHVEAAIRYAFGKIGLAINYNNHSVSYEDSTREAEVTLEDQEVTIEQLNKLAATGLSDHGLAGFKVVWGSDALSIHFVVAPAIDDAKFADE